MIISSEQRKDKLERRVKVKTLDNIFYTVIKEGTNCSAFEARTILENARRIYRLGDYQEERNLKPGQLKIIGVDGKEPAGKPQSIDTLVGRLSRSLILRLATPRRL